jgi:hypothetical protein
VHLTVAFALAKRPKCWVSGNFMHIVTAVIILPEELLMLICQQKEPLYSPAVSTDAKCSLQKR